MKMVMHMQQKDLLLKREYKIFKIKITKYKLVFGDFICYQWSKELTKYKEHCKIIKVKKMKEIQEKANYC